MIILIQAGGGIRYKKNKVIRWIVKSIVTVIQFSGKRLVESGLFLVYIYLHSKGNHPPKSQQTHRQTNSQHHIALYILVQVFFQ